jgi:hypothetical protein
MKECQETTVCHEATEADMEKIGPESGMMQSVAEHQEVPREDAAVMPVRGLRKQRRGRKQAAGRREEPEKLNRGMCGSREKLAAACRKVSRRATVACNNMYPLYKRQETKTHYFRIRAVSTSRFSYRVSQSACEENLVHRYVQRTEFATA